MTQRGFWREWRPENRRAILADYGVVNQVFYLFPQGGGPRGAFTTFADIKTHLRSRDVILLSGVLLEQAVAPVGVYDVSIIGAANQPRQATNGGVPTGGGASWLAPASPDATTPLLRLIEQGWSIENIQMAPVAASACITFDRRETAAIPDSSHGTVLDCYFSTGGTNAFGIELIEVKKINIISNLFEGLTGDDGTAIKGTAGDGIAAKSYLLIRDNRFIGCTNDVNIPSTDYSLIQANTFFSDWDITPGIRIKLDGSTGRNRVIDNQFSDIANDITNGKGYTAASDDEWRNWASDTNVPIVTTP